MRTLVLMIALVLPTVSSQAAASDPGARRAWYSIQVQAVPLAEVQDAIATYRDLRDKGYLAYAYRVKIDGAPWVRVAVGVFGSRGAAAEFGSAFEAAEGREHFVTGAPVQVRAGTGDREFVVTPSALWIRGPGGARQVFPFTADTPNAARLPADTLPALSPSGDSLAFVHDARVYVAPIDGSGVRALTDPGAPAVSPDADYPWQLGWSPSGQYVAFLDEAFWEHTIGLWVAHIDGGAVRCLACNRDGQSAVRWFVWHPEEDRVLFVEGFAMGTVAVGGGLFSGDVDGTIRTLIASEPGHWKEYEEIAGPLRIEDGYLHFRRVRWLDDNFIETSISEDRLPAGAL